MLPTRLLSPALSSTKTVEERETGARLRASAPSPRDAGVGRGPGRGVFNIERFGSFLKNPRAGRRILHVSSKIRLHNSTTDVIFY